jgi:hypothetical protein
MLKKKPIDKGRRYTLTGKISSPRVPAPECKWVK